MDFGKAIKTNLIIWGLIFLDTLYIMYSKYKNTELLIQDNGVLFSKILIVQALILFLIYFGVERFLFRKSRLNRFAKESPKKIIIPFYIITVVGLAFGHASALWGAEALKASGETQYLYGKNTQGSGLDIGQIAD